MKYELTNHQVGLLNSRLKIVAGEQGNGGAPVQYTITSGGRGATHINFHQGLLIEVDGKLAEGSQITGLSNEALVAIVEDRLRCFQEGPFPCAQNGYALKLAGLLLDILNDRTAERSIRGVEGRQTK